MNTTPLHRAANLGLAVLLFLLMSLAGAADVARRSDAALVQSNDRVALTGHVLSALAQATADVAKVDANRSDELLTLTVVLNRSDPDGFAAYLADLYDASSPNFRKFLSPTEVSNRFGPHALDYDAVKHYFSAHGFRIGDQSLNRLTLGIEGTRTSIASALNVAISDYRLDNKNFFANSSDPSLPANVASLVNAVVGLTNLATARTSEPQKKAIFRSLCKFAIGAVSAGISEADKKKFIKDCYALFGVSKAAGELPADDPPPPAWQGVDGTGQKIGIVAFDTFNTSDVADYFNLISLPATQIGQVSTVHVNGGAITGPNQSEVLLDIAVVSAAARGAQIVVYDAPNSGGGSYQAIFNAMVGGGVNIISNSWAYCEDQTTLADVQSIESILQTAAASGVSAFSASGDSGSSCLNGHANTAHVPATSPHITAVGGTSLTIGPGFTYGGETWWDGSAITPATGQGGYGVSRFFARPSYQNATVASAMRSVPDVAANADPQNGVSICRASAGGCPDGLSYGGTSAAAPLWAAFAALLNQSQGSNLGFFNPLVYPLVSTDAFHDAASMGTDFAHVGLGSPNLPRLHQRLTAQTAGIASPSVSQVHAHLASNFSLANGDPRALPVPADGVAIAYVVVRLADALGNVVGGKTVSLSSAASSAVITPAMAVTRSDDGIAIFTVTNLAVETLTFTATDVTDGVTLAQTARVAFVVPTAASGSINALTGSAAANGVDTDSIIVLLQDSLGRPTPGKLIRLEQTGSAVIRGPNPSVTNASGQIVFTVSDTKLENVVFTAYDESDGDLRVPGSASVNFSAGGSENCGSTSFGPNVTAAPGYAFTPFATGFLPKNTSFGGVNYGCRGAGGMAFDPSGNLFVADIHSGNIYKFPPAGGVAGAGTLVTTTPLEPGLGGLTFGLDGKLYAASNSTTGNFFTGAVREINPNTGAVVRIVAASITCASYMATDPISGDLFVDDACGGAGSDNGSIWRISNPGSATPTTTVYAATAGTNGGLAFSSGGTLYVLDYTSNGVTKVTGTNKPQPPVKTLLLGFTGPTLSIAVLGAQANGDATTMLIGTGADPSGFPAGIKAFDITGNPVTTTSILVNNTWANVELTGPDGCQYVSVWTAVYKITNADGTCPLVLTAPRLALSPAAVAPNPAQGSSQSFTATFHYTGVPDGTPVLFTIIGANAGFKLANTNASGSATISYVGVNTGLDTIVASATVGSTTFTSNVAKVTWSTGLHATSIDLNSSPTGAVVGSQTTLAASLVDISVTPAAPISGVTISLTVGSQFCNAITNASGVGSCNLTPSAVGNFTLTASFTGNSQYTAATVSTRFAVTPRLALDIDGDGIYNALTDGLLILRWMSNASDPALANGAIGTNATRRTAADIAAYLTTLGSLLDIDGNGQVESLKDGLLIMRYLFGFRGAALINDAVGANPTRFTAADIEAYLRGLTP